MSTVDVISSFCLATGLLKSRTARNTGIMKVLLPFLSPFYYACKNRMLPDMYVVGIMEAQTLQLCNLKFCIFLKFFVFSFL